MIHGANDGRLLVHAATTVSTRHPPSTSPMRRESGTRTSL